MDSECVHFSFDTKSSYVFILIRYREALDQIPSFLRLDMSEINPTILNYKPCRAVC